MIVWINGAFGSGKTQAAYELQRRLERAYVYDPENAGFFIRDNLPLQMIKPDFQDYVLWREFNTIMLRYISSYYNGVVIVPMTVTDYMEELIGTLRMDKIKVNHFVLQATRETLHSRLKSRFEGKNSWASNQIERCIKSFSDFPEEEMIKTDEMTIDDVVKEIAVRCGLTLLPDKRGSLQKKIDRLKVKLRHIR